MGKNQTLTMCLLRERPEYLEQAALWFSEKWDVPFEAYYASMQDCLKQKETIPQWYIVVNEKGDLIAGAGIIENDFHERKDLTPNLCALFVTKDFRCKGIATSLLEFVKADMHGFGINKIYLVTDHTSFYEKCGWKFVTMVKSDDLFEERLYESATFCQDNL